MPPTRPPLPRLATSRTGIRPRRGPPWIRPHCFYAKENGFFQDDDGVCTAAFSQRSAAGALAAGRPAGRRFRRASGDGAGDHHSPARVVLRTVPGTAGGDRRHRRHCCPRNDERQLELTGRARSGYLRRGLVHRERRHHDRAGHEPGHRTAIQRRLCARQFGLQQRLLQRRVQQRQWRAEAVGERERTAHRSRTSTSMAPARPPAGRSPAQSPRVRRRSGIHWPDSSDRARRTTRRATVRRSRARALSTSR